MFQKSLFSKNQKDFVLNQNIKTTLMQTKKAWTTSPAARSAGMNNAKPESRAGPVAELPAADLGFISQV
jgi:hypothetical protein